MAAAKTPRRVLVGAIAASLAAHLLVVTLLVLETRSLPTFEPPPALDVDIVRPLVKVPRDHGPAPATSGKPVPAAPRVPVFVAPPPEPVAPLVIPPPIAGVSPQTTPQAEDPAQAAARDAVREGFGCDRRLRSRLSPAEQAACDRHERQYAARKGQGPGAEASLDLDGRFVKQDEPYLSRMPSRGCKPRVSGAGGDSQNDRVIVGLACVLHF